MSQTKAPPIDARKDDAIHADEARFHDDWAASTDVASIELVAQFEGVTALEFRFIQEQLGGVRGKRVLEVGSGLGEASTYFAKQGAVVTATDLSAGMLRFVNSLASHHGVRLDTVRTPGERLPFRTGSFDVVYIANSLHHVNDVPATVAELRRVLKSGGHFISMDPLAYNPVINLYRRMATGVRTTDEHPLTREDVASITWVFRNVRIEMFWLTTLLLFLKFYAVDWVHPNADRYWKRIYKPEVQRSVQWWFRPLATLDRLLMRLVPPLRWWAWNVVIIAEK